MNVLSLFAGVGGLELGLERAGMTTVGQVEIDPYCRRVLAKHLPEVPRHDDVRTTVGWWESAPRPRVHVVAGGFPCQPVSSAGARRAQEDPRWLWPAMAEVIRSVRPSWVIGENVPGLLTRGISDIVRDLGRLGYRYRVGTISACAMGAPHTRDRVFVMAHTEGIGCHVRGTGVGHTRVHRATESEVGQGGSVQPERPVGWTREPRMDRVAYGVPNGVDRLRALGNAVVPRVSEFIGRRLMEVAA